MVATDTIVGIVGAVLLVAVMAGVFVYEYNNPAEAQDMSPSGQMAHFEEDYAGMSAGDDIDGDGQANYVDDDIDGDGTSNENDTDTAYHAEMSGAVGPSATLSLEFYVGNGSVHVIATVDTALQAPNPLVSGNLIIELVRPDGSVADNQASSPGGPSSFTVETQEGDEIPAGDWKVVVRPNQVGLPSTADISADVHYPAITAEGHGHTPERP
ncbi:MAG TPA: hypothetical protein VM327_05405 [Candidatus Thermoplasmatota archaeon]|nr:hypothetical protein [Candidatus Thermoplasmatota archaeon]